MRGAICPDLPTAAAMAIAVRDQLGYPKLGLDVGGGMHGPPFFTTHYGLPIKHPTLGTIAFPFFPASEAVVATLKAKAQIDPATAVIDLPADWVATA